MADLDRQYDITPQNANIGQRGASIAQLKAALTTFNATSYSPARLLAMSERDLTYAVKVHGLSVAGV